MLKNSHDFSIRCFAIVLISVLFSGCVPLSAKDLRSSSISGKIEFKVETPKSVLQNLLFDISTKCLYRESGVVTQSVDDNAASSNITFSFTDSGYYLNTVTIDMVTVDENRTNVVIFYTPSVDGRWQRYAVKVKEWALKQKQNCDF